MYTNNFPAAPAATIRSLAMVETKDSIDMWFNQVRAFLRAIPSYQKYMDLTWKAHAESPTRGFVDTRDATGNNISALTQSTQVEALIDLVLTYAPELDVSHIRSEATSLNFIYKFIREHYGVKRTGRQMMRQYFITTFVL